MCKTKTMGFTHSVWALNMHACIHTHYYSVCVRVRCGPNDQTKWFANAHNHKLTSLFHFIISCPLIGCYCSTHQHHYRTLRMNWIRAVLVFGRVHMSARYPSRTMRLECVIDGNENWFARVCVCMCVCVFLSHRWQQNALFSALIIT